MKIEAKPRISVGVPVFNGGELIKRAIALILAQTEQNFEIIISDNNSSDGSSEYLQKISESDDRISYYKQKTFINSYDNFRFVLSKAQGEYFMWVSHDDERDLNYIQMLCDNLDCNKKSILAFGDLVITKQDDHIGKDMEFLFETKEMGVLSRMAKTSMLQCFHIYGVWRMKAAKKIPYAYCTWWPDLPMMIAASIMGSFIYVPGTRFKSLEVVKTSKERSKYQDNKDSFNLLYAVFELVGATYKSCSILKSPPMGVYGAMLVLSKQIIRFPGFIIRSIHKKII